MLLNQSESFLMNENSDRQSLFGNNVAAIGQPLVQPPVSGSDATEVTFRHALATLTFESEEKIDGFEQLVYHGPDNARLCVQVNMFELFLMRAAHEKQLYKSGMNASPVDRIAAALLLSGKSFRKISEAAKLGVNYVSHFFIKQTLPKNDTLAALCKVVGVDMNWVLTGLPRNKRIDTLLDLFSHLSFDQKREAIAKLAEGEKLSVEDLSHVSEQTNTPIEDLREWISGNETTLTIDHSTAAFDELSRIANGRELDIELLQESLEEAYELEFAIAGRLGPPEKRAQLVKKIYALKLSKSDRGA
ncbi:hypothetical protein Q669_24200 [Labrenzia sp. C1B10]|nr:hypothetical protein Q669_24200 [Labrenzia sp. C1B10]ERS02090.1 hypothetical protein Q675_08315 [Labrenzia sp. C1B70]